VGDALDEGAAVVEEASDFPSVKGDHHRYDVKTSGYPAANSTA
jgi:hypothetical protein